MDLTIDPVTGERRDREVIRNLLQMIQSSPVRDSCHQASLIHNCLSDKFWREREGHGVCWPHFTLGLIQWETLGMLCCHTSLGIGAELVHNQQGNMISLDIFTCYATIS